MPVGCCADSPAHVNGVACASRRASNLVVGCHEPLKLVPQACRQLFPKVVVCSFATTTALHHLPSTFTDAEHASTGRYCTSCRRSAIHLPQCADEEATLNIFDILVPVSLSNNLITQQGLTPSVSFGL